MAFGEIMMTACIHRSHNSTLICGLIKIKAAKRINDRK